MTSWSEADIPQQHGRSVLVTGANSGLGLRSAKVLACKGARVLLACRDIARGERALAEVRGFSGGDTAAELVALDLADLSSIRRAAADVRERTDDRLDILINNAGVMATPQRTTVDGFELQFGTNHLGHAALTWLLMPALRACEAPRVVTLSSMVARSGRIDLADPNFRQRRYLPSAAYGQSKLANLLFALELDRRSRTAGTGLRSIAAHPGLTATELSANMARSRRSGSMEFGARLVNVFAQPVRTGALPQLYAALAPDAQGGDYIGPGSLGELRGRPRKVPLRNAEGQEATAARLWDLTAELTGVEPAPR